ncbi:hypothetical protein [Deinococcus roseus]|uniref:Uncharacterized protein n=1 Tax=Deinococcus roseus TaxID=392414 RepID=A0ABQ2DAY9_9DEIO|nr:hypothetical protein [Deinococcus roseus]GGJ49674.1 hypothetical protein GCM10008938_39570 [Deinococcus roseus]
MAQEFLKGENPDPAYYRYSVFRRFMDRYPHVPELHFAAFLQLAEQDPPLKEMIIGDLLERPECPQEVLQKVARKYTGELQQKAEARLQQLQL